MKSPRKRVGSQLTEEQDLLLGMVCGFVFGAVMDHLVTAIVQMHS